MRPQGLSQDVVEDTRRFWQARTGERVSDEDAREAVRNVTAFFDLLARWDADNGDKIQVEAEVADERA